MMNQRIVEISKLLLEEIKDRFNKEPLNIEGLEFSESFAEILDRFIVLHIRVWKLEDEIGKSKDDKEIAELKRKIDYCFKIMRPKLIRAINFFLDVYVDKNYPKPFSSEDVKLYEGFQLKK